MIALDTIRKRRAEVEHIAQSYGVTAVRVFGSVASGEQRADSDLDVLVTLASGRGLFDLIGFEQDLSAALGVPVQAISDRGLSPRIGPAILAEAVAL